LHHLAHYERIRASTEQKVETQQRKKGLDMKLNLTARELLKKLLTGRVLSTVLIVNETDIVATVESSGSYYLQTMKGSCTFDMTDLVETDEVEEKPVVEKIIDEIRAVNESRKDGSTISNDDTNEELINIFRILDVDVEDDEDALRQAFGDVGFEDMREAESGCYQ